jgi:hypothetical protein
MLGRGRVVRRGRDVGFLSGELLDEEGVIVAVATATVQIRTQMLGERHLDHGSAGTVVPSEGAALAVEGVDFVGLRTDQFSEMVQLFRDVIGMPLAREAAGLAGFRLGDDAVLEVYGPADEFHSFFTTGPVVGLRVGDFDRVRERMLAAGVEFIGVVQHVSGMSWQHFRCPDGTVLEIIGPGTPNLGVSS